MDPREAVVLVTGASAGIGRAAALAFDRTGSRVAMVARRRERLEENAARMHAAFVAPADLAVEAEAAAVVDRTVEHFGRIDVLINNAGMSVLTRSDAMDADSVRRMLEVNFVAAVVATERAAVHMRRAHRGHVINVGSPAGLLGVPFCASYSASKAAMRGWTRSLQAEWAGTEIFVTEYHPGLISTEMHEAAIAASDLQGLAGLGSDVFADQNQSAILRWLGAPLPAEKVADDLVECVRRPRAVMYSSPSVRFGVLLAQLTRVRLSVTTGMARAFRQRTGASVFTG